MLTGNDRQAWGEGLTTRDQRNARRWSICLLVWVASFTTAVVILPVSDGSIGAQPMWAWALAAVPVIPGVLLVRLHLRLMRETDELMRKIHLEALAVGFGVAFVWGMSAALLGQLGIHKPEGVTWFAMYLAYWLKLGLAVRRYRA